MCLALAIELLNYQGLQHYHAESTQFKMYRAHFGISPTVTLRIWNKLNDNNLLRRNERAEPRHLLWCLYFLYVYPTETVGARTFNSSRPTFRKWVWTLVVELELLCLKEVRFLNISITFMSRKLNIRWIKLSNRYRGDIGNDCLLTVDGVDCMTLEPQPFNRLNFSHKFNGPAVRYEVAISILGGDICWVNGPFRPGANPDAVIFSSGLRHQLDEGARVEADNGYPHSTVNALRATATCQKRTAEVQGGQGRGMKRPILV